VECAAVGEGSVIPLYAMATTSQDAELKEYVLDLVWTVWCTVDRVYLVLATYLTMLETPPPMQMCAGYHVEN
jgi:hypothetical protein